MVSQNMSSHYFKGVKIYSHTEASKNGKRMSGPMILEKDKGMITKPVHIKKDAFIGTNTIILPGVTIGEGAIIGANCVIRKSIPDYKIVIGNPPKLVGKRKKVSVPNY